MTWDIKTRGQARFAAADFEREAIKRAYGRNGYEQTEIRSLIPLFQILAKHAELTPFDAEVEVTGWRSEEGLGETTITFRLLKGEQVGDERRTLKARRVGTTARKPGETERRTHAERRVANVSRAGADIEDPHPPSAFVEPTRNLQVQTPHKGGRHFDTGNREAPERRHATATRRAQESNLAAGKPERRKGPADRRSSARQGTKDWKGESRVGFPGDEAVGRTGVPAL